YDWNENDGNLNITGSSNTGYEVPSPPGGSGYAGNILNVAGDDGGVTWEVGQDGKGSIVIKKPNTPANAPVTITASGLQAVSLDVIPEGSADAQEELAQNEDFNEVPTTGPVTYQVDDLSGTGIRQVSLNQHEQANDDTVADKVVVQAPAAVTVGSV